MIHWYVHEQSTPSYSGLKTLNLQKTTPNFWCSDLIHSLSHEYPTSVGSATEILIPNGQRLAWFISNELIFGCVDSATIGLTITRTTSL